MQMDGCSEMEVCGSVLGRGREGRNEMVGIQDLIRIYFNTRVMEFVYCIPCPTCHESQKQFPELATIRKNLHSTVQDIKVPSKVDRWLQMVECMTTFPRGVRRYRPMG